MPRLKTDRRRTLHAGAALSLLWLLAGCSEPGPRSLTEQELQQVTVEGRVSKWLPIRFSGTVHNESTLHLERLELEIHGKTVRKDVRIAPGESDRMSLQYLFPEDEGFGTVDPAAVEWQLIGATGSETGP
ncbi:MAG: hypothetical protein AAGA81_02075 [Acidobacteriota bacterium]